MAIALSQIATLRRVLEAYCSRNDLTFSDRPAISAARELMKFADEGENDAAVLARRLDEVMQAADHRQPLAPRAALSSTSLPRQ